MNYREIKNLKDQVLFCLEKYPEARNSDITLMIKVWQEFYGIGDVAIKLEYLYDLPREDNIKRIRAKLQNEKGIFLPTIWEVAKKRGINENEWRVAMGYPTKETTGTDNPSWIPDSELI